MTAPDGFKQACANGYCFQAGEPITVWRNPSYVPTFDAAYRYSLQPMSTSGKAVDVANGSTNNGTTIQQYAANNADAQKFTIQKQNANWKIALKANTNKCFGPQGKNKANATRIEVQDCDSSPEQEWNITADANTGAFQIKNIAAARCLDVSGASTADGAPMQIYDCTGANNQKFKLGSGY
jgi:glucosylceramidase